MNGHCGVCEHCIAGDWYYCVNVKEVYGFGNSDQGSFGTGAVWREPYLFHIPKRLASDAAAPLMCAGITVWTPLTQFGVKPTDVVGVVGIGGLGHLAVQFAAKLGCEVVALSGTEAKKEKAFKDKPGKLASVLASYTIIWWTAYGVVRWSGWAVSRRLVSPAPSSLAHTSQS